MRRGTNEFLKAVHDNPDDQEVQAGPGDWQAVAKRVVTMGKGATAIVARIGNAVSANADPDTKPKPASGDETDAQIIDFPIRRKPTSDDLQKAA